MPEGGDPEAKTKAGDAPAEGTEAPAGKAAASQGEARKARVLVVDDNAEFRGLLQQALSKGYEVVGAVDGQDAMAKIREESRGFDVVVTDLKMPNVDGIAFLEGLQEPVPTIVISGFLNRPEFQEALGRLEHVAVLEKPFKMAEMREAIEKALGGKAEKH